MTRTKTKTMKKQPDEAAAIREPENARFSAARTRNSGALSDRM